MERWAANTLRVLGIVVLGHVVLGASLLLLLLSICSWNGGFGGGANQGQGVAFLAGAMAVLAVGIWIIARLARGIIRAKGAISAGPDGESAADGTPALAVPFHFSPSGQQAVQLVAGAMAAQIALSAAGWFWSQFHFWQTALPMRPHNWTLILLAPFVLYHVPYLVLIARLLQQPGRRELAYSLAVPGVILFQSMFSLSIVTSFYIRQPIGFLLLLAPWLLHIAIIVLAYKAIQITGSHPEPALLLRAAILTVVYFSIIHIATPLLYMVGR
jgi:hypothetical protein